MHSGNEYIYNKNKIITRVSQMDGTMVRYSVQRELRLYYWLNSQKLVS